MKCTALLEHRVETNDRDYLNSGNVLLDKLFDCAIEYRQSGLDMNAEAEAKGEALKAEGGKPYVIPGGGSNRVGALGYVSCAQELMQQADEMGLRIDRIVTATGSAGTHAGLVVGLQGCNAGIPVLGIGVRNPKDRQETMVHTLAEATADYVGVRGGIPRAAVEANCDYVGAGYGQPTEGMGEAVLMLARLEGVSARPGLFRQGDGGADRPDPQGRVRQGRAGGVPAHRRRGRTVRIYGVLRASDGVGQGAFGGHSGRGRPWTGPPVTSSACLTGELGSHRGGARRVAAGGLEAVRLKRLLRAGAPDCVVGGAYLETAAARSNIRCWVSMTTRAV